MSAVESEKITWWREFLSRRNLPPDGCYYVVPESDDDPREVVLLSESNLRTIPLRLGEKETMEECAAFFRQVMPKAKVMVPTVASP